MTLLCAAIFVESVEQAKRDIARAAELGAEMVELRIDRLADSLIVRELLRAATLPCIVTCRPVWEGGESMLSDFQGVVLRMSLDDPRPTYFDIELRSIRAAAPLIDPPRDQRSGIIVSSHDFQTRPEKLHTILGELSAARAEVNKIVWTARTVRDNLEAFEILKNRTRPTIALCMGEAGLISRVLAKKFSAFLSFASLDANHGTAPGQLSIATMKSLYRWDSIGEKTRVFGVVGSPIAHSMSPAVHNAAFDATGFDGVYLPLLVEQSYESFKAFIESFLAFAPLDLSGLSITIPHKENALRYLRSVGGAIEPLAERIGAVNTIAIARSEDGAAMLSGFNTDYAAILDCITQKLGIAREQLADYRVAVLGAGGVARTAVAALAEYGATVVVYNRTMSRAEALANEFNGKRGKVVAARWEKICDSCCHIFINGTSVGMHPNVEQSPLGERLPAFSGETLVFDTIYNPRETKLLKQAANAGAKTLGGIEMFLHQAAAQFEIFTGMKAPIDAMRHAIA